MGDQHQDNAVKAPGMGGTQDDRHDLRPGQEKPEGQNRPDQGQRTPGQAQESPGRNRDQGDQDSDQGKVE